MVRRPQALVMIGTFLSFNFEPDFPPVPVTQFLPLGVHFFAGFLLLLFRRGLARELFRELGSSTESVDADSSELQDFAVAVLGLWILVLAISSGAATEASLLFGPSPEAFDSLFGESRARTMISADAWIARIPYLVKLICGALLYSTSGRLVQFWRKLRELGKPRNSSAV